VAMLQHGDGSEDLKAASIFVWAANKHLARQELTMAQSLFDRAEAIMNPDGEGPDYLIGAKGNIYTRIDYARGMSDMLAALDQPAAAGAYARVALELNEKRFDTEKIRSVANAELKFAIREQELKTETVTRDAELARYSAMQSRQDSMISLMVALFAGTIAILLFWGFYSQKRLAEMRALFLLETQHRAKNNLQILSSLINMGARREGQAGNAATAQEDASNRARTMALVHEHMYQQANGDDVDLKPFLEDLVVLLDESLGSEGISLMCKADSVTVPADDVTAVALLVCELVTNAYKHAFGTERIGAIEVRLMRTADAYAITVSDDGAGFSNKEDALSADSIGLGLINDLAEQLGGVARARSDGEGVCWTLEGFTRRRKRRAPTRDFEETGVDR
ncbi:MAG: sensor histidine kinase, partial [Pseudomonadota bacterium]